MEYCIGEICIKEQTKIDIRVNNPCKLTTEQVAEKPIKKRDYMGDRIVGKCTEADEDYIYGVVYDPSVLIPHSGCYTFEVEEG